MRKSDVKLTAEPRRETRLPFGPAELTVFLVNGYMPESADFAAVILAMASGEKPAVEARSRA